MPANPLPSWEQVRSFLLRYKLYLAGGVTTLLVAGLIAALLALPGERDRERAGEAQSPEVNTLIPREEAFLPDERERLLELEEYRYREPLTPWEPQLVDQFWNPVRETAIEVLTEQAREEVDALFEAVE